MPSKRVYHKCKECGSESAFTAKHIKENERLRCKNKKCKIPLTEEEGGMVLTKLCIKKL